MVFQVKKVENHISKIIVHFYFMILNTLTNVNKLNLTSNVTTIYYTCYCYNVKGCLNQVLPLQKGTGAFQVPFPVQVMVEKLSVSIV